MSNSNDYELVDICTKCKNIQLKSNFHERLISKNNKCSHCNSCRKK